MKTDLNQVYFRNITKFLDHAAISHCKTGPIKTNDIPHNTARELCSGKLIPFFSQLQ